MSKQYTFKSINDVLVLDENEFIRFIPDFIAWFGLMKTIVEVGAESIGMTWVDDGKGGEIHSVSLTIKETGEEVLIKGSAFEEQK